mmetsp:Transcript_81010/g.224087  ORF Transcript_81010/g.224087 Transcript_81010/m.224087 type:complete len:361 (-) Transcript_81010:150-1232(-)
MGACASHSQARENYTHAEGKCSSPQNKPGKVDLVELLPQKDPQLPSLLLSGKLPDYEQEPFAEKPVEVKGATTLETLGRAVGFACRKGRKGSMPNQDNFLILQAGSMAVYGVFDGHGTHGQKVSSFVAPTVVQYLAGSPSLNKDPVAALRSAFVRVQEDCVLQQRRHRLDCKLSGTTATVLLDRRLRTGARELCIAHCGDSRAVLGHSPHQAGAALVAMDLTTDHKPGLERERERIEAAGGVVRRQNGDPNERVFVRNSLGPGLAMSRSIGDTVAASVGVISEPDIRVLHVQRGWRFVLLCSDGVWEFMSSQEAVELVGRFSPGDAQEAANQLVDEAQRRWLCEEASSVDDITAICLWLL